MEFHEQCLLSDNIKNMYSIDANYIIFHIIKTIDKISSNKNITEVIAYKEGLKKLSKLSTFGG